MGHLGATKYWVPAPSSTFDADETVSAYDAIVLRDRIAHLVSSAPGYRVNWVADQDETSIISQPDTDDPRFIAWRFPITMTTPDRPPSLDVRVGGKISGSATLGTFRVRILWDHYSMQPSTAAGDQPTLFNATATTASTTGEWVHDTNVTFTDNEGWRTARQHFETDNNGTKATADVIMARLEVVMDGTFSGSGGVELIGVSVREFL